jgi:hypothetical protein
MSTRRVRPFPALAAPVVLIVAMPIAMGWRYHVKPRGRAKVTSYTLRRARETAQRHSRKIIEVGPAGAFDGRGRR